MARIRYFTDEDVFGAVAGQLRNEGIDAISTPETGRLTESDVSHLAWAAGEARTLVTFNISDYAALHTEWLQNGLEHAGIIVAKRVPIGTMVRRLLGFARQYRAEDTVNKSIYLANLK